MFKCECIPDIERWFNFIEEFEAVMDFVNAAAQEYYGGKTSAEEAAHIVMSKLKIYFAERD